MNSVFPARRRLLQRIIASFWLLDAAIAAPIPASAPTLEVALRINGREAGEITALLDASSAEMKIDGVLTLPLASKLKGIIPDSKLEKLKTIGLRARLEEIREQGLPIEFDEQNLEIQIVIPIDERLQSEVHVLPPPQDSKARLVESPPFSASLTPAVRLTTGSGASLSGEIGANAFLEDWGFESLSRIGPDWRLDRWEFQRDFTESGMRLRAGRLSLPTVRQTTGSLASSGAPPEALLGLALSRETSIRPQEVFASTGSLRLKLDRPSRVKVWMQERLVSSLTLDSGIHELTDFPAIEGYQEAILEIQDDLGNRRVIQTNYIHYPRLLKPGKAQWIAAAGTHGNSVGWIRSGILAAWTAGLGTSRSAAGTSVWAESTIGLPWGFLDSTLARDWNGAHYTTHSQTLVLAQGRLALGWEQRLPAESLPPPASGTATASATLPLASRGYVGARGSWIPATHQQSLQLSGGSSLAAGLQARGTYDTTSHDWLVTLTFQPPTASDHRLQFGASSMNASRRMSWTKGSLRTVPNAEWSGTWESNRYGEQSAVETEFFENRGVWGLGVGHQSPRNGALRFSGALHGSAGLGFAGGRWGWGRPVQGGFVIIDQKKRGDARPFLINPRSDGSADASWSSMAPALLPRLTPHRSTEVTVRGSDREEIFQVKPKNLQGTLVVLGDDGTLQVHGVLRLPGGAAAALATGVLRARAKTENADGGQADGGQADGGQADGGQADGGQADGGQADGGQADGGPDVGSIVVKSATDDAPFFTNSSGEFWAQLKHSGNYHLALDASEGRSPLVAEISIPEKPDAPDLDTLELGEILVRE